MTKWIPIQRFEINVRDYLEQGFQMLQKWKWPKQLSKSAENGRQRGGFTIQLH